MLCALRVGDGFFARDDIPFAPRSDDLQFRRERFGGQFEAHLIVAFASAAVRDGIRAEFFGELHLALREKRARERSAEQIFVFVHRAGAQRGPDVAGDEFLAQVFDVRGACAGGQRFLARGFQIFLLAEVADHGDHFAAR